MVLRIMILPSLMLLVMSAFVPEIRAQIGRLILFFGIPFPLLVLGFRWVGHNYRPKSFGVNVLISSLIYLFLFTCAIMLVGPGLNPQRMWHNPFLKNPGLMAGMIAICYAQILLVTGIRGVANKLGPGVMWNWIRGYYYSPKQEERIFMFLDIRDSTSLAEQLGDMKFSELVRDFFEDLTGPILESRGAISHYIGDEVVLHWKPEVGLKDARFAQCFFRMQLRLEERAVHYVSTYGLVPGFKAGAHIGSVVATEVGKLKSEIVFHGDVLNTTARVQSLCNELNSPFLITKDLADRMPAVWWLDLKPVGDVELKGKQQRVALIAAAVMASRELASLGGS